jgi:uncharacterized membrane protein
LPRFNGVSLHRDRGGITVDHRQLPPHLQSRNDFFWQDGPYHGRDEWWQAPLHAFFVLLLVALLVIGIVWLVRRLSPSVAQAAAPVAVPAGAIASGGAALSADPAVATLRMRYAKGEVSREDFQNAIQDLTGAAPTATWPGAGEAKDTPTAS